MFKSLKIIALAALLSFVPCLAKAQGGGQFGPPIGNGGGTTPSSVPGTPGVTAIPVQSGLMAEYRMLPSETCGALVDYSGNGRVATGTAGTAPTIISGTGGCNFTRNGAINLPATLNTALTIQVFFSSGAAVTGFSGCIICGNGTAANSAGLFLVNGGAGLVSGAGGLGSDGVLPITSALRPLTAKLNGTSFGVHAHTIVAANAPQSIAWVMDSVNAPNFDRIYMGTTESNMYFDSVAALNGVQTSGNFALGGVAPSLYGDAVSWFSGQVYYLVMYNRILTAAEVAQNAQYMQNAMALRGVQVGVYNPGNTVANQLVADGDSITGGPTPGNTGYVGFLTLNGTWNLSNSGQNSQSIGPSAQPGTLYGGAKQAVDPLFWPQATGNAVVMWAGTNDNATSAEPALQGYCNQRRAVGWKCFVVTMLSRTAEDTFKNTYNTWMRQNWPQFADGLIDMAADPNLGADAASANTNFFIAGGVHPLQSSIYNNELPIIQRAINRYYGNKDFSTANVYASAAAAAVATTAGSETGNTITITFGATPANCLVGNVIVIAGTTPAGYSNAAGWTIRTRSATQVTAFINTTGLGAITVQGTGVCTQQQDVDTYSVLNFGAGNFTLQSCQGYTGQNIFIRNINAAGTTLVPFNGETITGPGTTTVAAATTAILQSQLVSSAAGGCNWVRLQ